MTTKTRVWLLAACAASVLLALLALMLEATHAAVAGDRCVSAGNPDTGRGCASPARATPPAPAPVAPWAVRQDYIVQADRSSLRVVDVRARRGRGDRRPSIYPRSRGCTGRPGARSAASLGCPRLRIFEDSPVQSSSAAGVLPETNYPSEVAASNLHVGGVTGRGVTVAVLDSGVWSNLAHCRRRRTRLRTCSRSTM